MIESSNCDREHKQTHFSPTPLTHSQTKRTPITHTEKAKRHIQVDQQELVEVTSEQAKNYVEFRHWYASSKPLTNRKLVIDDDERCFPKMRP